MGSTQKAGTVHRVGSSAQDRLEQDGKLVGIVFEVRVLDDDDVPGCSSEACAQRSALARVLLMEDQLIDQLILELFEQVTGPVGGAIVHDDHFELERYLTHPA